MSEKNRIRYLMGVAFLVALSICGEAQAPAMTLETAVAALRGVDIDTYPEKEREAKAKQIDAAWDFLFANGTKASDRLKEEIEKIDRQKEKDDFFKLNATVVLWKIGKANEAAYIAKVWESTPLERQYNYVFYTAFEAAGTHDPRVLPMLKAVLKDDKGSIYIAGHAMRVAWPLSHEFLWGVYGLDGLPVLAEILEKSDHEIELKSAMILLGRNQYLPSLTRIRQLASSTNDGVRRQAVQALGIYGHPADYDRLIAGLKSNDPREVYAHAFALYEFEDQRAVPHLIPLLEKGDDGLRVEVSLALLHLLTVESLAAVKQFVTKATNPEVKDFLGVRIRLREDKLPKDYWSKPRIEQASLLSTIRNQELAIQGTEPPLTNARLLEALRIWKEKGRIYDSGFAWVGEGRVIAAAKPENIDQLISTKASFYKRLSDECLYEVRDLEKAIKYIGRSRYRLGLGVVEKAEPK